MEDGLNTCDFAVADETLLEPLSAPFAKRLVSARHQHLHEK